MSPRQPSWINVNGVCVCGVITDSEHQVVMLRPYLDNLSFNFLNFRMVEMIDIMLLFSKLSLGFNYDPGVGCIFLL